MQMWELQNKQFINQELFFDNYQKNTLIKIKNDLKVYFENIDEKIFLSSWRKNKGYIPDGFKSRTIITIYGPVTFKRRVYKYWNKYRYCYVFLVDKKLQIEKYSRITSYLKFKILEQIATGKRQRDICDMFYAANITRATISNIIRSFDLEKSLKYFNAVKIKIPQYLYINMDETFIKLRKWNKMSKYRIRLITFHTGYNLKLSTNKRKVLDNKRVYFQLIPILKKINTEKFMTSIKKVASKFYSNIDDIKIIICGDGARWIREASHYWLNSNYILDKFHAVRYLKQISLTKNNKLDLQAYHNSKSLFELGAYNSLIDKLKQISIQPDKKEKLTKIINYFTNNALGIINQKLEYNIGVSAEADVSHIIKWLLGYGSKAFNYQTFKNMLLLRASEINKLDIISFLKKEYQLKSEENKNFYWKNYWPIKKNISY